VRTGAASIVALEDFIQAVQSQLDTAQARMTLKAQNDSLPLTFAIRDITMDLKAQVEMQDGQILIKPAGSGDTEASVLHLVFTAITKPMIEENAVQLAVDATDDTPLTEMGDELSEEEIRRLDRVGVRTVSKLNEMRQQGLGRSVGRITNLPIDKLERVLSRATRPMISDVEVDGDRSGGEGLRRQLRVRGRNLLRDGSPPRATIDGKPVGIVQATDTELVLAPREGQLAGQMSLAHDDVSSADVWFDLSEQMAPPPAQALRRDDPHAPYPEQVQ
jgi:hypothetical protein